jgi:thioredoxin-dependent peroxiredoxin
MSGPRRAPRCRDDIGNVDVRVHNAAMRYPVTRVLFALVLVVSCKTTGDAEPVANALNANGSTANGALVGASSSRLNVGDLVPDVALPLHNGKVVKLSELRGKAVVLYFYPKDDTPGCRVEAQGFRDLHGDFLAANAVVFGVSTQDEASHQAFIEKENLPFDLVIDSDGKLANELGVKVMGTVTARQTVLIDGAGKLVAKWVDVTPKTHAAEVLAAVKTRAPK